MGSSSRKRRSGLLSASSLAALLTRAATAEPQTSADAVRKIFSAFQEASQDERRDLDLKSKLVGFLTESSEDAACSQAAICFTDIASNASGPLNPQEVFSLLMNAMEVLCRGGKGARRIRSVVCAALQVGHMLEEDVVVAALDIDRDLWSIISDEALYPRVGPTRAAFARALSALLLHPSYFSLAPLALYRAMPRMVCDDSFNLACSCIVSRLVFLCPLEVWAQVDAASAMVDAALNGALVLSSEAAWRTASTALIACLVSLVEGLRARGMPIDGPLSSLWRLSKADQLCLALELGWLGQLTLAASSQSERDVLMKILECTLCALNRPVTWPSSIDVNLGSLMYPLSSLAASGAKMAPEALALISRLREGYTGKGNPTGMDGVSAHSPLGGALLQVAACATAAELIQCCDDATRSITALGAVANGRTYDMQSVFAAVSLCLDHHARDVRLAALSTALALANASPLSCVSLIPYLLGRLKLWSDDGEASAQLLHALPLLGKHRVPAKQVSAILAAFLQDDMDVHRAMSLQLMGSLARTNSHVLSRFEASLEKMHAVLADTGERTGVLTLSVAAAFLDLCKLDPEVGVEHIQELQQGLTSDMPEVVALSLESLAELIRRGCLDFRLAFKIVQKPGRVRHYDTSTLSGAHHLVLRAMTSLCRAGGEVSLGAFREVLAGQDKHQEQTRITLEPFVLTALGMLWPLYTHPHFDVRDGALLAVAPYAKLVAMVAMYSSSIGDVASEEQIQLRAEIHERLLKALDGTSSPVMLGNILGEIVNAECDDISTFKVGGEALALPQNGARAPEKSKEEDVFKFLPVGSALISAYVKSVGTGSEEEGLSSAVLWCFPCGSPGDGHASRDEIPSLALDLLGDEELSSLSSGTAASCLHCATVALGVQRFVESWHSSCIDPTSHPPQTAHMKMLSEISSLRLGELALSHFVALLPDAQAEEKVAHLELLMPKLQAWHRGKSSPLIPLCLAIVMRSLPVRIVIGKDIFIKLERYAVELIEDEGLSAPVDNVFWACLSLGVSCEGSARDVADDGCSSFAMRSTACILRLLHQLLAWEPLHSASKLFSTGASEQDAQKLADEMENMGTPDVCDSFSAFRDCACLGLIMGLQYSLPGLYRRPSYSRMIYMLLLRLADSGTFGACIALPTAANVCSSNASISDAEYDDCAVFINTIAEAGKGAGDVMIGIAATFRYKCRGREGPLILQKSIISRFQAIAAEALVGDVADMSLLAMTEMCGCSLLSSHTFSPTTAVLTERDGDYNKVVELIVRALRGTAAREKSSRRQRGIAWRCIGCLAAAHLNGRSNQCTIQGPSARARRLPGMPAYGTLCHALMDSFLLQARSSDISDRHVASSLRALSCGADRLRVAGAEMISLLESLLMQYEDSLSVSEGAAHFMRAAARRDSAYAAWAAGITRNETWRSMRPGTKIIFAEILPTILSKRNLGCVADEIAKVWGSLLASEQPEIVEAYMRGAKSVVEKQGTASASMLSCIRASFQPLLPVRFGGDAQAAEGANTEMLERMASSISRPMLAQIAPDALQGWQHLGEEEAHLRAWLILSAGPYSNCINELISVAVWLASSPSQPSPAFHEYLFLLSRALQRCAHSEKLIMEKLMDSFLGVEDFGRASRILNVVCTAVHPLGAPGWTIPRSIERVVSLACACEGGEIFGQVLLARVTVLMNGAQKAHETICRKGTKCTCGYICLVELLSGLRHLSAVTQRRSAEYLSLAATAILLKH